MWRKFATRRINVIGQNFTCKMSSLLSKTRVKSIKIDEHTCIIHLLDNMSLAWAGIRQLQRRFLSAKIAKRLTRVLKSVGL